MQPQGCMMVCMRSYQDFEDEARRQGFDAVGERRFEPHRAADREIPAFAVKAILAQGEMWLTVAGQTRHLAVGDAFELGAGVPYAARSGENGATWWLAQRADDRQARKPPEKSEPHRAPLTPVTPKIGESAGNLKKRAEAFSARRGKPR
jgi:hypothetical protein